MGKEAFTRKERRATGAQKDCKAKHDRTGLLCGLRQLHRGQHKAKTRAGYVYWS